MGNNYNKEKADNLSCILKALLLSNQNKSLKISHLWLNSDLSNYDIMINNELMSGDIIISVVERRK